MILFKRRHLDDERYGILVKRPVKRLIARTLIS